MSANAIDWCLELDVARRVAAPAGKMVLALFDSPQCKACKKLDAATFADPALQALVAERFVGARLPLAGGRDAALRNIRWTPTTLVLTPDGVARHRFAGFLPADEYAAEISYGRGRGFFEQERWPDAIAALREVPDRWPDSSAAPAALYWWGAADWKKSGRPDGAKVVWKRVLDRYPASIWAKSVGYVFEP